MCVDVILIQLMDFECYCEYCMGFIVCCNPQTSLLTGGADWSARGLARDVTRRIPRPLFINFASDQPTMASRYNASAEGVSDHDQSDIQ